MNKNALPQVDSTTFELAEKLRKSLEDTFCEIPALALDYSWPTVGVIDLITFPLRKKPNLSDLEKELLYMTTAYLGVILSRVWEASKIDHTVQFDELKGGVCILFKSEKNTQEEYLLTNYIHQIFFSMPQKIEVLKGFKRPFVYDGNILSSVFLGIVLGNSPIGISPLVSKVDKDKTNQPDEKSLIERAIARLCSEWFTVRYPEMMLAQVPDLFLQGAVLPPLLYDLEEGISETLDPFISYLNTMKVPLKMVQQLANIFSTCPDEKISYLGTIISLFAYPDYESLPSQIKASLRYHAHLIPAARKTILKYRNASLDSEYLLSEFDKKSASIYEYEKKIGTLPWFYFTSSDLMQKREYEIDNFITSILNFEYDKAYNEISEIVVSYPADIGFRIQHLGLEMLRGDYEYAHELAKILVSEPEIEKRPDFYSLWANCLLKLDEPEIALRYFKSVIACSNCTAELKADALNGIAWCYICLRHEEEAMTYLQEAELMGHNPLTVLLNKAYIYRLDTQNTKSRSTLLKAVSILPFDRRVFSNL